MTGPRVWTMALALMLLTGPASPSLAQPSLIWTAGAMGGEWYAISGGMAELLRQKAGIAIKVVPGGGAQNPVLIEKGEAQIGLGLPPLLGAARQGDDPYTGTRSEKLRGLAGNMSFNTLHLYVAADSPFARMTMDEIFRGRKPIRLAIGKPGTSDVWMFEKVMEYFELCAPDKISDCYRSWERAGAKFFRGSYAEQAAAFKDRSVDGTFASLALPAASIREASQSRQMKLLAFPPALLDYLTKYGLGEGAIPAGTYPRAINGDQAFASATMGTTVTVSSQMADDLAYLITRTINDNADLVRLIHPSLADYDPAKACEHLGVPLHPGAERYYREKGWLP
ncbi:MAG TPA: TAXI family TRAP transporter solute-binding subunit [Candidatus Methylomirabilis sp.]|nr:TAXI family TRAP transporter solute-binding subunit [Candidatus Methylomirabilis sp.]